MTSRRANHESFETLTARLFGVLDRVESPGSLVSVAQQLLDAELVVLVRPGTGAGTVLATYPKSEFGWASDNLDALRWWAGSAVPDLSTLHGFQRESELQVAGRSFSDALVAFGGLIPRTAAAEHELLVFQPASAKHGYTTYHCSLGASLLRRLEHIRAVHQAARQSRLKDTYVQLVSLEALLECSWDEFVVRLEGGDQERLSQPGIMGPAAILWTGYRKFGRAHGADGAPCGAAREWLASRGTGKGSGDWAGHLGMVDFLLANDHLNGAVADNVIKAAEAGPEARKALLVVLEHAWRLVYRAASDTPDNKCRLPSADECAALLRVTSAFALEGLSPSDLAQAPALLLDRDSLRLYLAMLVCGSTRIRNRYLGIREGPDGERRSVPGEVRRTMLLNAARFMLSVVQVLERRSHVVHLPAEVSRIEVLDGLLYVVDRFAHVELEVDERLNTREHLAGGLRAEVAHHLSRSYYRDHLLHVIDVFLLGHLLLRTEFSLRDKPCRLVDHLVATASPRKTDDWMREWAVAALFHDVGYQLDLPARGASDGDFGRFFHLPRPVRLEWLAPNGADANRQREALTALIAGFKGVGPEDSWLPRDDSYPLNDHGVLSALRVAQVLAHAATEALVTPDPKQLRLVERYWHALHAIAHHNLSGHTVQFASHPLACLLRLCDELQEWGRRRVSVEHMVKRLYLQIEHDDTDPIEGRESLARVSANLRLMGKITGDRLEVRASVVDGRPHLTFWLEYRDPVSAQYDAISMLLSKAYSLQHVDFSSEVPDGGDVMEWRLIIQLPRPAEYRGLTELDLYGLARESVRAMPELWRVPETDRSPAGLVWLTPQDADGEPHDRVAIVVRGPADESTRRGWQTCDPGLIRDEMIAFKRQLLTGRSLGREKWWLNWLHE